MPRPEGMARFRAVGSAVIMGGALLLAAACGTVAGGSTGGGTAVHHSVSRKAGGAKPRAYSGTITSLAGLHVGLRTATSAHLALVLTPSTKVTRAVAGHPPTALAVSGLAVGDRVRVRARAAKSGLTATAVTVLPAHAVHHLLRGVLVTVSGTDITLRSASGHSTVVPLAATTRVLLVQKGKAATPGTAAALKAGLSVSVATTGTGKARVAQLIRVHG